MSRTHRPSGKGRPPLDRLVPPSAPPAITPARDRAVDKQELAQLRGQLQAMERRADRAERQLELRDRDIARLNGAYVSKCQELEAARAAARETDLLLPVPEEKLLTVDEALAKLDVSCAGSCDVFDSDDACCVIRALRVAGFAVGRMRDGAGQFALIFTPPSGKAQ